MNPQESRDRRHGGRHLHRHRDGDDNEGRDHEGRHGGKHHKGGKKHGGKKHHGGRRNGGERKHHHKGGRHHGKHAMKWCMAAGVAIYTAIVATFLVIFKKFTYHYRQFHTVNELNKQSVELSVDERNKKY